MMSRMRPVLACVLVIAAAAPALGGCGGSSGDDGPTRAEYIAATDARCTASNKRTRELNVQLRRAAASASDDRDLLRRLAPILQRGYASVRDNAAAFEAADPPAADAAEVERIRDAYDEQAQQVRKLAAAARRGDIAAFGSLSEAQKAIITRARRLAREYGFRECGSSRSDAG